MSVESAHPLPPFSERYWPIKVPGAKYVEVVFDEWSCLDLLHLKAVGEPLLRRKLSAEPWHATAVENTRVLERLFAEVPRDAYRTIAQQNQAAARAAEAAESAEAVVRAGLAELRGHVTLLPLHYLAEERLLPALGDAKEYLAPTVMFV